MIVETLTTENIFKLQRKLGKEIETRKYVITFVLAFTPTGAGMCSSLGYACEDHPISLLELFEGIHANHLIHVNHLKLGKCFRETHRGQKRWDGKQPLFFYRLNKKLMGYRCVPEATNELELLEPTYQIKGGERYWVSKIDSMAVVKEREKRRNES